MIKHPTQWIVLTALMGILAVQAEFVVQKESLETGFALRFPSETGFRYTIEYRDNLINGAPWQELESFRDIEGTGDTLSYLDVEASEPHINRRYYRIRRASASTETDYVLALYEFTGDEIAPQITHDHISASAFTISSGSVNFGSDQSTSWTGSGVPYAQGNGGWGEDDPGTAKYFSYTLNADHTYAFSITNIQFLARATSAGPSAIGVIINDNLVYEADMPDGDTLFFNIPISGYNNLTQAVIRIPGWDNDSRDTGGGGHFRIDDVRTTGEVSVAGDPESPTVTNPSHSNISDTSATLGGFITHDGGATVTERGIYWSTTSGFTPPEQGTKVSVTGSFDTGAFTIHAPDLPSNTSIYFRAFAENMMGPGFSEESSFDTAQHSVLFAPTVVTPTALDITEHSALLGGTVTDDGGGLLVERGVYWSTDPDFMPPDEGKRIEESGEYETGSFGVAVSGLPSDEDIYFRAFAANAQQTGYSEIKPFRTLTDDDLVFYGFTGNTSAPELHREFIMATDLAVSTGSLAYGSFHSSQWGALGSVMPYAQAEGGGAWLPETQEDARHFHFTMGTDPAWMMTVTGVTFLARATTQGPSAIGLSINEESYHVQDMPENQVIVVHVPVTNLVNIQEATIQIQGWDNGSRDIGNGSGHFRIDNVRVTGSMSLDEPIDVPVVTNPESHAIEAHSATAGGTIDSDGGSAIIKRGIVWSTVADFDPTIEGARVYETGSFGTGSFTMVLGRLPPGTTIYYHAFAASVAEIGFTDQASFTTSAHEPGLLSLYEFTDHVITPHARHPYVTSSHLVHNTGRPGLANQNSSSWTGSGVPYAQMAGNLASPTPDNARHFVYTLEAKWGVTYTITNIRFLARATAQGPSAVSVSINGDIIHTQSIEAGEVISFNTPVIEHSNMDLATIRILGWDNGSRTTSGDGLLQIDDVRTEGTVSGTPLPPDADGRRVRVATVNVEDGIANSYDALKATLNRIDADVVAFQELYGTQTNLWAALAGELGYDHYVIATDWDLSGAQRPGYYSRYPIVSVHHVLSPGSASEITRSVLRVVVDVPQAENPLVLWNVHKKAMNGELDQFRRAVETIRIAEDIDAYLTDNPEHVEYIVLGDMNADMFTQPQETEFSQAWYNSVQDSLPNEYVLGPDIQWPVPYFRFPEDRYIHSLGMRRPVVTQPDGNGTYTFLNNSFISRLDYIYVSAALAEKNPAGEIYNSEFDGAYPGLPKQGNPLAPDVSWTSSDHLPVFVDVYMTPASEPEGHAETEIAHRDESTTGYDPSSGDETTGTYDELRELSEIGAATRLRMDSQSDGRVHLSLPMEAGYRYTIESTAQFGDDAVWTVERETQRRTESDAPIFSFVIPPATNDDMRIYRVRIKKAP